MRQRIIRPCRQHLGHYEVCVVAASGELYVEHCSGSLQEAHEYIDELEAGQ